MTKKQFIEMLSDMLAKLHDGHTRIHTAASKSRINECLPAYLPTIPDGAVMSILPRSQQQYLGMRLKAVDRVPVNAVAARYGTVRPYSPAPRR